MEELLLGTVRLNTPTLLLRKHVCLELEGFDESFVRHQDWEFLIRFFRKYRIFLPDTQVLVNKFISYGKYSNIPKPSIFIKNKNMFLEKFETDIDKFHSANAIYHKHFMEIVNILLQNREYLASQYYLSKACSFQGFSYRDFLNMARAFLSSIKLF